MYATVGSRSPLPASARATGTILTTVRLSTAYRTIRQLRSSSVGPSSTAPKTQKAERRQESSEVLGEIGGAVRVFVAVLTVLTVLVLTVLPLGVRPVAGTGAGRTRRRTRRPRRR